jgi:hypothetical protein
MNEYSVLDEEEEEAKEITLKEEESCMLNRQVLLVKVTAPSSINRSSSFFLLLSFGKLRFWSLLAAVVVHLRATGDAPILKQSKFKVLLPL